MIFGTLAKKREMAVMKRLYESKTGVTAHDLSDYHATTTLSDLTNYGFIESKFVNKKHVVYYLTETGLDSIKGE